MLLALGLEGIALISLILLIVAFVMLGTSRISPTLSQTFVVVSGVGAGAGAGADEGAPPDTGPATATTSAIGATEGSLTPTTTWDE
ncbi:hypothetical protein V6N11_027238 [Hibiscus sabdariffa]|uniref:Uncharacterized protein n=1 Tax=Hibiscus sabdariffa TaxID=183260 RepID=A0ABR2PGC3_9ROSI